MSILRFLKSKVFHFFFVLRFVFSIHFLKLFLLKNEAFDHFIYHGVKIEKKRNLTFLHLKLYFFVSFLTKH